MKLKPLKEVLKMAGDKVKESLAPVRVRKNQKKAELKIAEIEERQVTLEAEIQEMCMSEEINFDRLVEKQNKFDLLEREKKQLNEIIVQLFPV